MKKILCDTNIFISAFNGRKDTIQELELIGLENISLSVITVMELYQGMGNKKELAQMKKLLKYYDFVEVNEKISSMSVSLIEQYNLGHGLLIPDAIIAATSVVFDIPLFAYNIKDFQFIPDIRIYKSII